MIPIQCAKTPLAAKRSCVCPIQRHNMSAHLTSKYGARHCNYTANVRALMACCVLGKFPSTSARLAKAPAQLHANAAPTPFNQCHCHVASTGQCQAEKIGMHHVASTGQVRGRETRPQPQKPCIEIGSRPRSIVASREGIQEARPRPSGMHAVPFANFILALRLIGEAERKTATNLPSYLNCAFSWGCGCGRTPAHPWRSNDFVRSRERHAQAI